MNKKDIEDKISSCKTLSELLTLIKKFNLSEEYWFDLTDKIKKARDFIFYSQQKNSEFIDIVMQEFSVPENYNIRYKVKQLILWWMKKNYSKISKVLDNKI